MVLYLCLKCIMKLLDMLIKEVVKEKVHLLYTQNHGMLISLISYNSRRIMVKKNKEPETYFMPYGSQIYSCKESKMMGIGHCSAQMKLLDYIQSMVRNSISFIKNMSKKEKEEKLSKLKNFGKQSLILKLKQEHPICCIKTNAIVRATKNILEQSRALICVVKSLNIQLQMRQLFAIQPLFLFQGLQKMVCLTLTNSMKSLKWLQEI